VAAFLSIGALQQIAILCGGGVAGGSCGSRGREFGEGVAVESVGSCVETFEILIPQKPRAGKT
jgi:hypothetical protein